MKPATVKQLKDELKTKDASALLELCLSLSKFKKENKELLTYLLFEADDEQGFITNVKEEIAEDFSQINVSTYYIMKKSVRKVLRNVKKYIRYSKNKQTEVELLMYFCKEMRELTPSIDYNTTLSNLYNRQIELIRKRISMLHEDLQYDYELELEVIVN